MNANEKPFHWQGTMAEFDAEVRRRWTESSERLGLDSGLPAVAAQEPVTGATPEGAPAPVDVNDLPVTPAAVALYKLASRWGSEAFRLGRLLDQKHPRALALEDCSAALRDAVNGLRRDGEL